MKTTSRLAPVIAALSVAAAALGGAAPARAADPPIPVAHSALLVVDATRTSDGFALHVKRAGNQQPFEGQDVKVAVDGKEQLITPQPEGTFLLSTQNLTEGERRIDVTVGHDGIRETLTGTITIPKAGAAGGNNGLLSGSHGQLAWWILNVVIVLIAVIGISNRKPKRAQDDDDEAQE